MPRVESDAGHRLDDLGEPLQGPELCGESVGARSLADLLLDELQLSRGQLGLPACSAGSLHRGLAALTPCLVPTASALSAHPKYVSDCSLLQSFLEQASGAPPSLLELEEIAPRPFTSFHAAIIYELAAMSLYFTKISRTMVLVFYHFHEKAW